MSLPGQIYSLVCFCEFTGSLRRAGQPYFFTKWYLSDLTVPAQQEITKWEKSREGVRIMQRMISATQK
ncbi:hypothetical protein CW354_17085 [Marinicaulis flavus]|uniref:Uncharacterized protein n=1 Tax=Hyphococcus luteus TaxID=2058213 RepID=A0A2S7K0Q4_9PROT|nr:hypothetical protein CW354_17085 [Marinicaulis flavus]